MSSTYRLLCLSHDPVLTFGEYDSPEEAEGAVRRGPEDHPRCDLLIGRYSYPLIQVGCPSTKGRQLHLPDRHVGHGHTEWVDVVWLRLLAAIYESGTEPMRALTQDRLLSCWTQERLRRLREELKLDSVMEET